MSEQQTEVVDQTADSADTAESAETDWQSMARKHEKAAKELRAQLRDATPKLQRLATLEAATQSEAERQAAALSEAQTRAEKAERNALRASVALTKGLPANLAARLQGDDQAALEADADELLSLVQKDPAPRTPRPDMSQGSSSGGGPAASEGEQFAAFLKQQMGR